MRSLVSRKTSFFDLFCKPFRKVTCFKLQWHLDEVNLFRSTTNVKMFLPLSMKIFTSFSLERHTFSIVLFLSSAMFAHLLRTHYFISCLFSFFILLTALYFSVLLHSSRGEFILLRGT